MNCIAMLQGFANSSACSTASPKLRNKGKAVLRGQTSIWGGGGAMRIVRGPLFKPLDVALMVGFAMAFVLLTSLRLA